MNADAPTSPSADDSRQPAATTAAPPRFRFSLLFQIWLAVVLMGTVVTLLLPEWFTSTARIKIERDQTDLRGFAESPAPNPAYDPYFLQTEFEIIQSETILGRVIDGSNLNEKWGQKYIDGGKLKTSESLSLLRGRLDLRPVRNTTLIDIRVFSEDATEARDLANAIAVAYQQWRLD